MCMKCRAIINPFFWGLLYFFLVSLFSCGCVSLVLFFLLVYANVSNFSVTVCEIAFNGTHFTYSMKRIENRKLSTVEL